MVWEAGGAGGTGGGGNDRGVRRKLVGGVRRGLRSGSGKIRKTLWRMPGRIGAVDRMGLRYGAETFPCHRKGMSDPVK